MDFHRHSRHYRPIKVGIVALSLFPAAFCQAEIDYRVKIDPQARQVRVSIVVPTKGGATSVQIGNWMPGHYVLDYFYKDVHDVTASDGKGESIPLQHPDPNTWTAPSGPGPITFSYWVPVGAYKRFTQPNDDTFVQLAGAVNYMYVVGRKDEACKISFDLPSGWPALIGLDKVGRTPNTFAAPTFDVLEDNPLSTGSPLVDEYRLRGKDHFVVMDGAYRGEIDQERLLKYCQFVSASETDFFRGAPYHKYVWHFIVQPSRVNGGGGLEHLSSTQINLPSKLTLGSVSLLAHEYFHLWNVKRIRAKVLGPFDYLKLPQTGALWWSEGVTDYYASLLPYRYGAIDQAKFLDGVGPHYAQYEGSPARLEVSPYQSSYRLSEASGATGSSGANSGYKISFYNLGWLCGLCLDTEIRFRSNGKHSLDDVMRALYDECKDSRPGFAEDEIRKQCIRFGGPELGSFYDKVVMTPAEMPVADQLAKVGLTLSPSSRDTYSYGFVTAPDPSGVAIVASTVPSQKQVVVGDRITSVDGVAASTSLPYGLFEKLNDAAYLNSSVSVRLTVIRGGQMMDVTVAPTDRTSKSWTVAIDPKASASAVRLREDWLKVKKISLQ